jgi:uncharacterized membrane protein
MSHSNPQNKPNKKSSPNLESYVGFERGWVNLMARFLTRFFGSAWFLNTVTIIILIWIVWNADWIPFLHPFDPYPFTLLPTVASVAAMLLAIVVLINQNEQGKMADVRQRIDFEINVRAENEITKILTMLDLFNARLGIVKDDEELDRMKEKTDIAEIKQDIEHGIEKEDAGKIPSP